MPPKRVYRDVYVMTDDGREIGQLGSVSDLECTDETLYSEKVLDDCEGSFTASVTIERNNYRKMHGRPLRRGSANWIGKLFRIPKIRGIKVKK